mmetsp:Transcript_33909/g.93058  ORF Transcript_33909/g.93058 Transcript_33909/m.93058 type:complete len:270 (-) Transcript_33909:164-973(-)
MLSSSGCGRRRHPHQVARRVCCRWVRRRSLVEGGHLGLDRVGLEVLALLLPRLDRAVDLAPAANVNEAHLLEVVVRQVACRPRGPTALAGNPQQAAQEAQTYKGPTRSSSGRKCNGASAYKGRRRMCRKGPAAPMQKGRRRRSHSAGGANAKGSAAQAQKGQGPAVSMQKGRPSATTRAAPRAPRMTKSTFCSRKVGACSSRSLACSHTSIVGISSSMYILSISREISRCCALQRSTICIARLKSGSLTTPSALMSASALSRMRSIFCL